MTHFQSDKCNQMYTLQWSAIYVSRNFFAVQLFWNKSKQRPKRKEYIRNTQLFTFFYNIYFTYCDMIFFKKNFHTTWNWCIFFWAITKTTQVVVPIKIWVKTS